MNDAITIGVDHGYYAIKTSHFSFPTGLVEYEHEPYTRKNVLEYGGKFYVVGSGRQPLQKDKTRTEDYYLLTLAAIAMELECRSAERTASVYLAAGLPLTSFGRDKKKFKEYLFREGRPVSFRYDGADYTVAIEGVSLFPQGYAAVLTQWELLDEPSIIVADIGGWTVDLMQLDDRLPNAATCRSLELGMIRCLDETAEQVRRTLGLSLTAAQIEHVLRCGTNSVDARCQRHFKMSIFAEMGCRFLQGSIQVLCSLIHHITCRFEARQALIYQLASGLTGENGKYNYSKAVHLYPPFFDIFCSPKNYKTASALTLFGDARAEDDSYLRGATMWGSARASGTSVIVAAPDDPARAPGCPATAVCTAR